MPPTPTFRFGGNTLALTAENQFTINFVHGGKWTFDTKEIQKLDSIVVDFQTELDAATRDLPRTNGGRVRLEYWLQHIFLHENKPQTYFLDSEFEQLRAAIRLALAEQKVLYPLPAKS